MKYQRDLLVCCEVSVKPRSPLFEVLPILGHDCPLDDLRIFNLQYSRLDTYGCQNRRSDSASLAPDPRGCRVDPGGDPGPPVPLTEIRIGLAGSRALGRRIGRSSLWGARDRGPDVPGTTYAQLETRFSTPGVFGDGRTSGPAGIDFEESDGGIPWTLSFRVLGPFLKRRNSFLGSVTLKKTRFEFGSVAKLASLSCVRQLHESPQTVPQTVQTVPGTGVLMFRFTNVSAPPASMTLEPQLISHFQLPAGGPQHQYPRTWWLQDVRITKCTGGVPRSECTIVIAGRSLSRGCRAAQRIPGHRVHGGALD